MQVRDVMTSEPVSVAPASSLRDAIQQMLAEEASYVVVVDKVGNPGGFLTADHVLQTIYQAESPPADIRVVSVADPPDVTLDPSTDIQTAAREMTTENVSAALVMDRLDFEGVVTVADIVEDLGTIIQQTASDQAEQQESNV